MARLVPEQVHAAPNTPSAAEQRQQKEGPLPHAPSLALRPALIDKANGQARQIKRRQYPENSLSHPQAPLYVFSPNHN